MIFNTRLRALSKGNRLLQVLAAQWVYDAVVAYNLLIEHVCALPQHTSHPGMPCKLPRHRPKQERGLSTGKSAL